ncbi:MULTISPECIES: TnsA-like heteromeric transposase endonuclease subunit [unclassified Streptomyces]|uniref:TnsA-like heteromeric transposase endonuclease subunit n=1 Tax=unclassified Streptomyces TaxID=2593676 RepID=UPI002DD9CE6A|nr:TnsA-like heteromeric transposase endonuclease subunit [Streptomyces sp. NBC_01750]WSB04953.1 TnsA-like heteromeric transposase endonuclease subunit [Streptomyces sp. NBC_01794]WSD30772.1 TnsA-like heteromeric transposase endonuclease subunit [Streptomyces sp. NBC_01750]
MIVPAPVLDDRAADLPLRSEGSLDALRAAFRRDRRGRRCRPERLVDEEATEVFPSTARICESVGWQFRLVGDVSETFRANLRRLARYRRPRCCGGAVADRLREVFGEPQLLFAGAERVGDRLMVPPMLYHLLWQHELTADLVSAPLGSGTVVCLPGRGGREAVRGSAGRGTSARPWPPWRARI